MPAARKPAAERRVPAGDTTGRQTQRRAQEHAEEMAAAAERMAMATTVERQDDSVHDPVVQRVIKDDSIADLSDGPILPEAAPPRLDPVEDLVEPRRTVVVEVPEEKYRTVDATVVVRAAENIEDMVYGDPYVKYSFVAGKRYRVPLHLAKHLAQRGLIYDRM